MGDGDRGGGGGERAIAALCESRPPFVPTPHVAAAEPDSLLVGWDTGPEDPEDPRPWEYLLQWRSRLGHWASCPHPAPPILFSGLSPDGTYTYRTSARRVGDAKWGPGSAVATFATPCTLPSPLIPGGVIVETDEHTAALRWLPPVSGEEHEKVRRFRVVVRRLGGALEEWEEPPLPGGGGEGDAQPRDGDEQFFSTHPRCRVSDLASGADYCAFVSMLNKQNVWGGFSPPICFRTESSAPGDVRAADVRFAWREPTAVSLYWAPAPSRGARIEGYEAQCRGVGGGAALPPARTDSRDPCVTLRELHAGCGYEVRLRARNARGDAAWSGWVPFHTPPPALATPIELRHRTQDSLTVVWRKLPTQNYRVVEFVVERRRDNPKFPDFDEAGVVAVRPADQAAAEESADYEYTEELLPPAARVEFRLRARCLAGGDGEEEEQVSAPGPAAAFETLPAWPAAPPAPRPVPGAPLAFTVGPTPGRGAPVAAYLVKVCARGMDRAEPAAAAEVAPGAAGTAEWAPDTARLVAGRRYYAVAAARSAVGTGAWGPRAEFRWDGARGHDCAGATAERPHRGAYRAIGPPMGGCSKALRRLL